MAIVWGVPNFRIFTVGVDAMANSAGPYQTAPAHIRVNRLI